MPSYGDLIFGLKDQGILPPDQNYSQHIANWIKIEKFHNQPLGDGEIEWITKFSESPGTFKKRARELYKAKKLKFGYSAAVNDFLRTNLDHPWVCNCSNCMSINTTTTTTTTISTTASGSTSISEDVVMEDLGPDHSADFGEKEEEKLSAKQISDKIRNDSIRLRNSDFSEDAILHRAMQILYQRYGTNARLFMKNIIDNEGALDGLKEVMDGLIKEHDKMSHEMFLHIADEHILSDNKVLRIAETIRSYEGRHSIEPNLREKLKEHGMECDKFFDVFEEEFDIHYKDEENKKIIHKVSDL